tara:strand:- start:771 stop:2057 length:1287 start_codon:yes stop_codon:yes gene_type:complete
MHKLHEVSVSQEDGQKLWNLFRRYPTVRICRNIIAQYVFERDIIVEGPKLQGLESEIIEDWARLKHDILDSVMAVGFAAVHVKSGRVPVVLPWECFKVTIEIAKDFSSVMRAYPVREQDGDPSKPIPNVVILDMFGFSPTSKGEIRSPMTPIMLRVHAILAQLDSALQADRARCRPAVYTEDVMDAVKPAEEVAYDYYADAESLERTSRNAYRRNQDAMAELRGQHELFQSYFCGKGESSTHDTCTDALESITPLPTGQKISRGPECMAPEQLVDRLRYMEQEVFAMMGVPRSFVMHDITVRHDAGMLHCSFTRTIHDWQSSIAQGLTYLFNLCNAKKTPLRKRKRTIVPPYTLRFERLPRVGVAEINHAYDRGVITWEAYSRLMITFCGLDSGDKTKTKDPWTRDERLAGWTGQKVASEFTKEHTGN